MMKKSPPLNPALLMKRRENLTIGRMKKKKKRRNPSKSLTSIKNTLKKHGHLARRAEDLHNSTLLSHLASAVFSSSSSSSSIPLLMSLFPPLGLEVELDRLYSVTRDEARPINSRGNLSFVFHWFCDLFVSSKAQSRGKGKSKAKRSLPPSSLPPTMITAVASVFHLSSNPSLNIPRLLSSILRLLHHRSRIVVSVPTPHPGDITPFLIWESSSSILRGINNRQLRRVFASGGVDLRVKTKMGGSAADAICLDDDNDGDGAGDEPPQPPLPAFLPTPPISCWVEAYCAEEKRWLHLDPLNGEFDRPANVEPRLKREWNEHPGKGEVVKEARNSVPYIVACEHYLDGSVDEGSITDVTRRYAASFATSKLLLIVPLASKKNGMFAGEFIYSRSDVSIARSSRKWLFEGRKVKDDELGKPAKEVIKRKIAGAGGGRSSSSNFVSRASRRQGGGAPPGFGLSTYNLDAEGTKESAERQKKLAEEDVAREGGEGGGKEMEALYGEWQ
ncbi:hypothetical protein TrRE_jg12317, partial [Triparma retinervis]